MFVIQNIIEIFYNVGFYQDAKKKKKILVISFLWAVETFLIQKLINLVSQNNITE